MRGADLKKLIGTEITSKEIITENIIGRKVKKE